MSLDQWGAVVGSWARLKQAPHWTPASREASLATISGDLQTQTDSRAGYTLQTVVYQHVLYWEPFRLYLTGACWSVGQVIYDITSSSGHGKEQHACVHTQIWDDFAVRNLEQSSCNSVSLSVVLKYSNTASLCGVSPVRRDLSPCVSVCQATCGGCTAVHTHTTKLYI